MPTKEETRIDYLQRVNKVLLYINEHLAENLDIESLSHISNFSAFHFHRIMKAHLRESLGSYIQRLRLDKAANQLLFTKESISDIATNVGYESPAAFSKAFNKRFDISPTDYRENISSYKLKTEFLHLNKTFKIMELKPKIKDIKPKKVIYVNTIGPYMGDGIGKAWDILCSFAKKKHLFGFNTEFIGVSYDDPKITDQDKLRYDACVTVRKEVEPEAEVGYKLIQGGKYAIFRHVGPYDKFEETYDYIFSKWLPESGLELSDNPCFEKYLNDPEKTDPEHLKTEIYVPIH